MVIAYASRAEGLRFESDLMPAHCSPSSKWVPGDNTGEIRRRGTHADGSGSVSSLKGTPLCTKVYETTFTFNLI